MTTQPDQSPTQDVTIDQAATLLGKSAATVRRMIKRGELEAVKATTPTGFVYRIRLPESSGPPLPTQGIIAQNRRSEALEGILAAFSDRLALLVEANDRQGRRIEELVAENTRLRLEVAMAKRSLLRRLWEAVAP